MRISSKHVQLITQSVHFYLGDSARIWLFGSRLDDQKRGGDVDLYVEAETHTLMDEIRCKMQLEQRLDMPVDLIVRSQNEDAPIARIARNTGLIL